MHKLDEDDDGDVTRMHIRCPLVVIGLPSPYLIPVVFCTVDEAG